MQSNPVKGLLKNHETKNLNHVGRCKLAAQPWLFAADPMGCGPFVCWPRCSSVVGNTAPAARPTPSSRLPSKQNDSQFFIPYFFNSPLNQ